MKKLLAIFALLPLLTWAFPVYTNRLDFDPAQSTGAFDDFLWRWSGFDDQSVELIFRNTSAPSNIGFRLAYPQRGRTFLDILPPAVPPMSNINVEVVTPWRITYQYAPLYPTITTPAFSNVFVTNFVLLNRDAVPVLSNVVTRVVTPATFTNVFDGVTVVGTNGATISNLFLNATSIVNLVSNEFVATPPVRAHTNYVIGITSTVSTVQSVEYLPVVDGNTNFYSTGPSLVVNGTFQSNIDGWDGFTTAGASTTNVFWSNGRANIRGTNVLQQVASGLVIGQQYFFSADLGGLGAGITINLALGDTTVNRPINTTTTTNFLATGSTLLISFTPQGVSATGVTTFDNVILRPVSSNRFVDTTNIVTATTAGSATTLFQPALSAVTSQVYKVETSNFYRTTFAIPRLSVPPDGPYFAEVLTYAGATATNPSQSRTLAKGQVTVENSLWTIQNYAGYTNFLGPWDYLTVDGSRSMGGNLNMGGNAVTNASRFEFTNGVSITASNVNLWNNFIQGTNVGLTVSTEFDGQITGVWNNLTIKPGVVDEADKWSQYQATQTVNLAGNNITNAANIQATSINGDSSAVLIPHIHGALAGNVYMHIRNGDTNTLTKGTPVVVFGNVGASDRKLVRRAASSDTNRMSAIAIVEEDTAVGADGDGIIVGELRNFNTVTNGWGINTELYVAPNGGLTATRPTSGLVQSIGHVSRTNANNGIIVVQLQGADVNYLPLAGGTITGDLRVNRATTASTTLTLTNNGSISTGLRVDLPTSSTFLDLNSTSGDEYTFTDAQANFHGNTIINAVVDGYLTTTGAAATYVQATNLPAEIVTTNNLSAIAGAGLGVVSNQLVVTNVAGTFEALTGNRFSLGVSPVSNISTTATGSYQAIGGVLFFGGGGLSSTGVPQILGNTYGASQQGRFQNNSVISTSAHGSVQSGFFGGTQDGMTFTPSITEIGPFAYGAQQYGYIDSGRAVIGENARGAMQLYYIASSSSSWVSNNASASIQLFYSDGSPEYSGTNSLITGKASILLGPGRQTNDFSLNAAGFVQSGKGFIGNAVGLTNFPSSLLTVSAGNANYWRITTAPTGATASGSSGQMAVSGTNLFIYSPNALGTGTARWIRVNAEANW